MKEGKTGGRNSSSFEYYGISRLGLNVSIFSRRHNRQIETLMITAHRVTGVECVTTVKSVCRRSDCRWMFVGGIEGLKQATMRN